jgi:protein-tyrosine phosphatase
MGIRRVIKLNDAFLGDRAASDAAGIHAIIYEIPDEEAQTVLRSPNRLDPIDQLIDASGEGGLLVHCTEGKDRTGIAIAVPRPPLRMD